MQLKIADKKRIRLCKEDFIFAAVNSETGINYCVEIRCQYTTSEDWEPYSVCNIEL
jgi:hypothetical protein